LFYDETIGFCLPFVFFVFFVFLSHKGEEQSGELSLQLSVQGLVIELGGHEKKVVL
jgi:hypothetical protein